MRKLALLPMIVLAGLALVAACGDDDDGNGGGNGNGDGNGGATVDIELREWAVAADPTSVSAGSVTFNIENTGPDHPHELVVVRTDLAADALPTHENGAVDEEAADIEIVDEVEDIAVDDTATLTVDLEPGSYVLICNIVEGEEGHEMEDDVGEDHQDVGSHYQLGMHTAFTVE